MKLVKWNFEKAQKLRLERNIELERIAILIAEGQYIGILDVLSRPEQKMFVLDYDNYTICVPFIESDDEIFIKTAFKNRKLHKQLKEHNRE